MRIDKLFKVAILVCCMALIAGCNSDSQETNSWDEALWDSMVWGD